MGVFTKLYLKYSFYTFHIKHLYNMRFKVHSKISSSVDEMADRTLRWQKQTVYNKTNFNKILSNF